MNASVSTSRGVCRVPPQGWYCTRGHGHEGPCNGRPLDPTGPVWYMRDNHTFRPLSGSPEQMVAQALEEFDAGYCGGMLCSNARQITVHAHGRKSQAEFAAEALAALSFVALASQPLEPAAAKNPEPWDGHEYQEISMGVWRCRKGCGPTLYSHLAPESVRASVWPEKFSPTQWLAAVVTAVTRLWPAQDGRGSLSIDLPNDLTAPRITIEFSERESKDQRRVLLQLHGEKISLMGDTREAGEVLPRTVYARDEAMRTHLAEIAATAVAYLAGGPRK